MLFSEEDDEKLLDLHARWGKTWKRKAGELGLGFTNVMRAMCLLQRKAPDNVDVFLDTFERLSEY